jgi:hypothetical protein
MITISISYDAGQLFYATLFFAVPLSPFEKVLQR